MFNKKIVIGFIVTISLVGIGTYSVLSNKDSTCYKYTSVKGSCEIKTCGNWVNGKRICEGLIETNYSRGKKYSCRRSNNQGGTYSTFSSCSIEESDPIPPTVDGGIE